MLRPFEPQDAEALATFLPSLLDGHWTAADLLALHHRHPLRVLVCDEENCPAVVGFAEFMQVLDEGHLLNIAIAPQWQSRGLGSLLLRRLWHEMRILGCERCLLEVRRSNSPARRLYERMGFQLDGVRTHYYQATTARGPEDALLYSLSSDPSS